MKHIKFSGLGLSWSHDYAKKFSQYLREIGYLTRVVQMGEESIVAYSHRDFTLLEAEEALVGMMKD